jgi:ribonuclease HII
VKPDFAFEREQRARGARWVAGVDEVGRGPLAGPVGVAAVILSPDAPPPPGIDDSKKLGRARREALFPLILESALSVSIAFASAEEIDRYNIRGATLRAMARAVAGLSLRPDFALIDGRDVPEPLPCPAHALIDGDALSLSIAAASIVAKVARDRLMARLDRPFPGYGFCDHAGYATRAHLQALARLGPTPLHRRSFKSSAYQQSYTSGP